MVSLVLTICPLGSMSPPFAGAPPAPCPAPYPPSCPSPGPALCLLFLEAFVKS